MLFPRRGIQTELLSVGAEFKFKLFGITQPYPYGGTVYWWRIQVAYSSTNPCIRSCCHKICTRLSYAFPDRKVHGTNMGPIWGRQDPGGPMLAPWTLLSGALSLWSYHQLKIYDMYAINSPLFRVTHLPIFLILFHLYCCKHMVAWVPVKESWRIWLNSFDA